MKHYKTNIPLATKKQMAQQKGLNTQWAMMMIFTNWCVCVCVCMCVCVCVCVSIHIHIYIYKPTHRPGKNIQTTYIERYLKFQANCSLQ